jgi:NAD(P)H dehydrogenase (quinone)
VSLTDAGFVQVARVSRTARGIYAAGDCTGVLMLATAGLTQAVTSSRLRRCCPVR